MAIYRRNAGAAGRYAKAAGIKIQKMKTAKETRNGVTTTYTMSFVPGSYLDKNGVERERNTYRITSDTNPQFEKNFYTEEGAMLFLNRRAGKIADDRMDRADSAFRKKRKAARKAKLARPNQIARRQKRGLVEEVEMDMEIISQKDRNGRMMYFQVIDGVKKRVSKDVAKAAGVKANPRRGRHFGRARNPKANIGLGRSRNISFHDLY